MANARMMKGNEACVHEAGQLNYDYVLHTARLLTKPTSARVLDFGCGRGELIANARRRGFEFYGADKYDGTFFRQSDCVAESAPFIKNIEAGVIPFADAEFDVVVANQVFEHIEWPGIEFATNEIARVLKPGGYFLALFPTAEVWFEGHLGLYFPQRMRRWPRLQRLYLTLCHAAGFGYGRSPGQRALHWSASAQQALNTNVFHHRLREINSLWTTRFGEAPKSRALDYMRYRVSRQLPKWSALAQWWPLSWLLAMVCRKRAGQILLVCKVDRLSRC
jgi:SAM-dependent methyltransferase